MLLHNIPLLEGHTGSYTDSDTKGPRTSFQCWRKHWTWFCCSLEEFLNSVGFFFSGNLHFLVLRTKPHRCRCFHPRLCCHVVSRYSLRRHKPLNAGKHFVACCSGASHLGERGFKKWKEWVAWVTLSDVLTEFWHGARSPDNDRKLIQEGGGLIGKDLPPPDVSNVGRYNGHLFLKE